MIDSPVVTTFHATAGDREFVLELGRRVAASSISALRPCESETVATAYENLVEYIFTRDHVALIATDDGKRAGFILVVFDIPDDVTTSPQAFVAYMAVEPEYQRQGIARDLLDAAAAEARERNLPYLSLMVTNENHSARRLYESAGFSTERRLMTKAL